jgi:lycopene cyclase CruA
MNITHTTYIELPAPLPVVRATLLDTSIWSLLPTQAEQFGEMWRWGGELYSILFDASDDGMSNTSESMPPSTDQEPVVLRWEVAPVATQGPCLRIEIKLYDATIATHAQVYAAVVGQRKRWPWQRAFYSWWLSQRIAACAAYLQTVLQTRQQVAATQPQQVRAPEPVLAGVADNANADTGSVQLLADSGGGNGAAASEEDTSLPARLRARYPQTVANFEEMGAYDHLERVWQLERSWERILRGDYDASFYEQHPPHSAPAAPDYDLIYAGGGLGLIHAAVMAQNYGRRVLLFDRSEVGCVHREWNISRSELQALVDMRFVTWDELDTVIMRDYERGLVKFHAGPACSMPESELWFPDVLNVAIDAGGLLRLMRRKFEQAGGTVLDQRSLRCVRVYGNTPPYVEVVLDALATGTEEVYSGRLLMDGMGSTSPLALHRHRGEPFAGVCPTVGTVVSGLEPGTARNEFDPTVGDILLSVADTQDGKQMIWEGFPGRGDELTIYMFYYAAIKRAGSLALDPRRAQHTANPASLNGKDSGIDAEPRYSLLALFEQYFALLPSYKKPGPNFRNIKPVYGYIPGRHSLQLQEAPLLRGVLPVGDSAAQQSPLTYCGFGSHVRNLHRTTSLLDYALRHDVLEPGDLRHISAFQTNVSLNWIFSRFMQPWGHPHDVNEIQNAFLTALNERGIDLATRFFRDRTRWSDYNQVVWYTMMHYKVVFIIAWPVLGVAGIWQWFRDYVRFSAEAAYAAGARKLGKRGEGLLRKLGDRISPRLGLRVRARYAEWRAMDWL